jgi:hypothetical protein
VCWCLASLISLISLQLVSKEEGILVVVIVR